ncbi:hypothetical protein JX265_005939 [Neoarthrinium moseri]|uniref:Haloalkanoic acid dehalogenase n=1 Tax=Neoarthrinium moseri TaxID=1658444 RepID=A0A9Q0APT1_9PEZI|nr:uncharacterized protein JN550_004154 [Neoarthrinium moseri]KAI1852102.1 hypothetical protein JX266_002955 [Neoarthrinium moseri]KAI1870899.1 hypothetical protein JX265_005939 [Neoarthrinium moseri]KAI1871951.1 hypothetical protein JN550_004154 [Neoarthrinium moseri]
MAESKHPDLTSFKALSFDVYGTLIDQNAGLLKSLSAITSQLPADHALNEEPPVQALARFREQVLALEAREPTLLFNENQAMSAVALAHELGVSLSDSVAEPFGNAPGTWAPFPDTVDALRRLGARFRLAVLSNVDNANWRSTQERQLAGVRFDAVCTAQDIGSYKPDRKNFEYLFGHCRKELGVDPDKGELLHVAKSLELDHVPAKELGLRSVWISRGGDQELEKFQGRVAYEWKFATLGEFADEVDRQFKAKGQ